MAARAGGTPARTARKPSTAKTAAKTGVTLPHPVPPREETLSRARRGGGSEPDTEADLVMLPGGFSFEPVRFDDEHPEDIRVTLFVGNDGTRYTVLANPGPRVGLEYVHLVGMGGGSETAQLLASDWLMGEMLGQEGYDALRGMRTADGTKYRKITAIVNRIAMGPLEIPKDAGSE